MLLSMPARWFHLCTCTEMLLDRARQHSTCIPQRVGAINFSQFSHHHSLQECKVHSGCKRSLRVQSALHVPPSAKCTACVSECKVHSMFLRAQLPSECKVHSMRLRAQLPSECKVHSVCLRAQLPGPGHSASTLMLNCRPMCS